MLESWEAAKLFAQPDAQKSGKLLKSRRSGLNSNDSAGGAYQAI